MQRNPYWPLNGPSFFSTTEIPSLCISLTVQVTESASGSNFAARMASRRNFFTSMPDRNSWPCGGIVRAEFLRLRLETSQDPDVNRTTSTVTAFTRHWGHCLLPIAGERPENFDGRSCNFLPFTFLALNQGFKNRQKF